MTIYYVKQFNLYYAGTSPDGTIKFANARSQGIALRSREDADKLAEELGKDTCEIEERVL